MKDRLFTIVISVVTSVVVMECLHRGIAGVPLALPVLCSANADAPVGRQTTLDVDRLIVRKELIVSDTGQPWEAGFAEQQIPRGIYAKPVTANSVGGLWVRSRLIKCELDDPFDDRFHALERSGAVRGTPGHLSWNTWLDGAWRQMAIIQGEGLELSEVPREQWNGTTHPGRLRFQTFRPGHGEPLTDALIGQGKMSLGGGGFGGGGLPAPGEVLDLWGGGMKEHQLAAPSAPSIDRDDASGPHTYALIAVGPQGARSAASKPTAARGRATISWESTAGADAYIILRDGAAATGPIRMEGSRKQWRDEAR
jgi:hypothetical protein